MATSDDVWSWIGYIVIRTIISDYLGISSVIQGWEREEEDQEEDHLIVKGSKSLFLL